MSVDHPAASPVPNPWATWFRRAILTFAAAFAAVVVVMLVGVQQQRAVEWEAAAALCAHPGANVDFRPHPSAAWLWYAGEHRVLTHAPMDHKGVYQAKCGADPRRLFDRIGSVSLRGAVDEPGALRSLAACRLMWGLFAHDCRFTPESWDAFAACKQVDFVKLRRCDLTGCDLGLLRGHDKLTSLDLAESSLADDRLVPLGALKALSVLMLDADPVTGRFLESKPAWPELTNLSVCATPFDDAAVTEVIRRCPNLTAFQAWRCSTTDASATGFGSVPKLDRLNLNETAVGDETARAIALSKSLRIIQLGRTRITGEGLLALAAIPTLKYLHVYETAVTEEDVARFQELRPNVNILGPGHAPDDLDLKWYH